MPEVLSTERAGFEDDLEGARTRFACCALHATEEWRGWTKLALSRGAATYATLLMRVHHAREAIRADGELKFTAAAMEASATRSALEHRLREADAEMRAKEQELQEAWEAEMREMAAERDEKVSTLTDQAAEAERSGAKHEATMLLQQARFFGARMDSKIAQRHSDGEKSKQERAEEHQRFKASERAAYDEERAKEQARDEQQH